MITAGNYVRQLLLKKNMTQMDLVRKINSIYGENTVNKQHLNNFINGYNIFSYIPLIEKALDLPENTLKMMMPSRSEKGKKRE